LALALSDRRFINYFNTLGTEFGVGADLGSGLSRNCSIILDINNIFLVNVGGIMANAPILAAIMPFEAALAQYQDALACWETIRNEF
jgi:hypothetical protein